MLLFCLTLHLVVKQKGLTENSVRPLKSYYVLKITRPSFQGALQFRYEQQQKA